VSENRFCIGQEKVEEKSNEITAIPKVLESLDIEEAVVTTDITGTQTKIAGQIIGQGGRYFLSVKGNQQGLPDDLEHAFRLIKVSGMKMARTVIMAP
jgi:predicted transposase YbfD/YdcC